MESFFREVKLLEAHGFASQLWNADETGFCTAVASQRSWLGVAHERFMRQVEGVGGTI